MKTTVIHMRDKQPGDVYIGRKMYGRNLYSVWGNPFKIGQDGTREQVIEKYRQYVLADPNLVRQLPELRGKRLVCWCAPKPCHGEVLAELADATADD